MRQIMSWTVGSFFRTIGRIVAFIVIGGLIAFLFSRNDFDWGIKDLFFTKVSASTYKNSYFETYYKDSVLSDAYSNLSGGIVSYINLTSTTNTSVTFNTSEFYLSPTLNLSSYAGGYLSFPFQMRLPIVTSTSSSTVYGQDTCTRWNCSLWDSSTNTCSRFTCGQFSTGQDSTVTDKEYITPQVIVLPILYFEVSGSNYWVTCDVNSNNNTITCPLKSDMTKINRLRISTYVYYSSSSTYTYYINLGKNISAYTDGVNEIINAQNQNTQAIENQTQQQQQQHEELMDTNMTETNETASNFFNSFEDDDIGGLSGIITAPLVMINEMLNGICVQPSATWKGATISLPCGDLLWSRTGASDLKNLLNVFYGGLVCYYAIRKLFLMIESMKDPTSDKIEVTDL